jgi:hypothetical protein
LNNTPFIRNSAVIVFASTCIRKGGSLGSDSSSCGGAHGKLNVILEDSISLGILLYASLRTSAVINNLP